MLQNVGGVYLFPPCCCGLPPSRQRLFRVGGLEALGLSSDCGNLVVPGLRLVATFWFFREVRVSRVRVRVGHLLGPMCLAYGPGG